jgi:magnesium-transporting ATPase (P-type)
MALKCFTFSDGCGVFAKVALVHAAAANGFKLVARSPNSIRLLEEGKGAKDYEVLGILEFSSERRRMGIIVRAPGGEFSLIIKGADSALLPLCRLAAFSSPASTRAEA